MGLNVEQSEKYKKVKDQRVKFVPLSDMKKQNIAKKQVLKSVAKMVADKEAVLSYIKGKTSIQTLAKKGIKFAKPL